MKRAFCLLALLAAGLFTACGGDDDSSPETQIVTPTVDKPSKLSKEQFLQEADGICAEVNAALGSLGGSDSSSAVGERADLYEGMIDRLRGLGRPDDDSGLDEVLSAGDEIVAAQKDAAQAAQDGDDTQLASAESDAIAAETTFSSAASSFGFEDCGQGATTPGATTTAPSTAAPSTPVAPVTTTPAPVAPAPSGGTAEAPSGGGTTGGGATGTTGGGATGTGGTSGSGGVSP